MATVINAGRVAMVPKGEWSATTAYTRLDVVLYQGSAWVCIKDGTGQTPADGSTYWQLLAAGITPSDYYTKSDVDGIVTDAEDWMREQLAGKQDSRLVVSVTHDAANDTYSANTTWAEIDAALSGGREVVVKYLGQEYTLARYGAGIEAVWYNLNDVTYTEVLIDSTSVTVSADFDLVDSSILPTKQDVSPITNAASGALVVNEYRDFGTVSALTVTLTGGTMANYDLYKFAFTCASDNTTLTLPSGVKLPVDMEMEMAAGRRFECTVDYASCLTYNCWD